MRHTSNELYVDIVESLSVIFAPSGRPISAYANGNIQFTAKISGVPDILLSLSAPGGTSSQKHSGITRTMALPSFHPCVRLAHWQSHPGELSFIPPDGKFMLAGYGVDLLPYSFEDDRIPGQGSEKLFLPATVDLRTGLGPSEMDFEAKVTLNTSFPGIPKPTPGSQRPGSGLAMGRATSSSTAPFSFGASQLGTTSAPTLESVSVTIPFPKDVRTVMDFRASRGDANFSLATKTVEWKIPIKDAGSVNGTATLTGTISGILVEDTFPANEDPTMTEYYDETATNGTVEKTSVPRPAGQRTKQLMPRSISASFTVKGWLPSGIKVDALMIDPKRSKGLGEGVKPYKGVKYLTVNRKGVERRVQP